MSSNSVFVFLLLAISFAVPAAAQTASGDLFVSTDRDGASIIVDDVPTGEMTPAMIRNVSTGSHQVTIETDCGSASQIVEIQENVITRAELRVPQGEGLLRVLPDPIDAEVLIDGRVSNASDGSASLDCGLHTVEVRFPGYQSQVREIRVLAGSRQELAFTLQVAQPGTLVVDVEPLTATIYLDGIEVSQGPVTLDDLSSGQHVVMAENEGLPQLTRIVDITGPDVTRIQLDLHRSEAQIVTNRSESVNTSSSLDVVVPAPTVASVPNPVSAAPAPTVAEGPGGEADNKRVGVGLTIGGVLVGAYAGYQYSVAAEAYERYNDAVDADFDDEAETIWTSEVAPAQRKMIFSGIVGGVSLLSGGIIWSRNLGSTSLALGFGTQHMEIRGTW